MRKSYVLEKSSHSRELLVEHAEVNGTSLCRGEILHDSSFSGIVVTYPYKTAPAGEPLVVG